MGLSQKVGSGNHSVRCLLCKVLLQSRTKIGAADRKGFGTQGSWLGGLESRLQGGDKNTRDLWG